MLDNPTDYSVKLECREGRIMTTYYKNIMVYTPYSLSIKSKSIALQTFHPNSASSLCLVKESFYSIQLTSFYPSCHSALLLHPLLYYIVVSSHSWFLNSLPFFVLFCFIWFAVAYNSCWSCPLTGRYFEPCRISYMSLKCAAQRTNFFGFI